MREIKSRGYNLEREEWVYGTYLDGYIVDGNALEYNDYLAIDVYAEVVEESVGEYTGEKDVNGREVYEHHIVKLFVTRTRTITLNVAVSFQGGMFGAENIPEGYGYRPEFYSLKSLLDKSYGFEVVGNIFENPELLTK